MSGQRQHAVVTGGSSGIGLAIALELIERDFSVTLIARGADRLEQVRLDLVARCGDAGRVICRAVDVSDETALAAAISSAEAELGPVGWLVCSAGIARPGHFSELDQAVFRELMEVNFLGAVASVRAVWPGMISRGTGRVVLISSAAGLMGLFGHSAYGASKFALRGFGEALQAEGAGQGVAVTLVYPPDTDTPQLTAEEALKPVELVAISKLERVWSAEEIARRAVEGAAKGRAVVYSGWGTAFLGRFGTLFAPVIRLVFGRIARQARAKRPN